jgi:hypothetical protein
MSEGTLHERILQALKARLESDPFFPPVHLDEPEPRNWRTSIPGAGVALQDFVAVQDGEIEVTRDGGQQNDWELELKAKVVYLVQGAQVRERRSRRDAAARHITDLVRAARDLGLEDPQVYAEIEDVERDDNVILKASPPVAMIAVTVSVQFIADSVAG